MWDKMYSYFCYWMDKRGKQNGTCSTVSVWGSLKKKPVYSLNCWTTWVTINALLQLQIGSKSHKQTSVGRNIQIQEAVLPYQEWISFSLKMGTNIILSFILARIVLATYMHADRNDAANAGSSLLTPSRSTCPLSCRLWNGYESLPKLIFIIA